MLWHVIHELMRVARHEQDRQARHASAYLAGKFVAVHIGHHHVGDEQVDFVPELSTDR